MGGRRWEEGRKSRDMEGRDRDMTERDRDVEGEYEGIVCNLGALLGGTCADNSGTHLHWVVQTAFRWP